MARTEIDLDGHIDDKGIQYIGKATWQNSEDQGLLVFPRFVAAMWVTS